MLENEENNEEKEEEPIEDFTNLDEVVDEVQDFEIGVDDDHKGKYSWFNYPIGKADYPPV